MRLSKTRGHLRGTACSKPQFWVKFSMKHVLPDSLSSFSRWRVSVRGKHTDTCFCVTGGMCETCEAPEGPQQSRVILHPWLPGHCHDPTGSQGLPAETDLRQDRPGDQPRTPSWVLRGAVADLRASARLDTGGSAPQIPPVGRAWASPVPLILLKCHAISVPMAWAVTFHTPQNSWPDRMADSRTHLGSQSVCVRVTPTLTAPQSLCTEIREW